MTNLINAERESKPGRDIAYCIDANYAKGTNTTEKSRRQLIMEVREGKDIKLLYGQTAPGQDRATLYVQQGRVYSSEGISPTLTTYSEKNAHIIENEEEVRNEHTIAYSKSHRDNGVIQARGKIDDEANTLSTGDGCGNQSTQNFVFNKEEDMSEIDIMNQPCKYDTEAVLNTDGVSQTLRAYKGGTSGPTCLIDQTESVSNIRIRKLTPVECERLQGYKDGHTAFGRLPDGKVYEMSNTQRYKMCGNGISSPVPAYLFPEIFGTEHIRVMSLFSGCGGTELLLPSNFEVVGHCEFDKHASAVLNYHYPNIPNFHDVTQFVDKEVPEFDLLVGGFPCQSWSIAGLRKGYTDDRGQLIFNVYDIIRKHKPKFICLENVKGLLSHSKGDAFEAIMEYLSSLGYDLDFEVVNSKHFNLAQNRERVFIFGKLK